MMKTATISGGIINDGNMNYAGGCGAFGKIERTFREIDNCVYKIELRYNGISRALAGLR